MEWLATHVEKLLAAVGLVTVVLLVIYLLRQFIPWHWRQRAYAIAVLLSLLMALRFFAANPVREKLTPAPIDQDRFIDITGTHVERLRTAWRAADDPRWPVAETLALACEHAYEAPVFAAESFAEMGFDRCEPIFYHSMVGYIASHDNVAIVAFRGTDFSEWSDWGVNKRILPEPTDDGDIHSGFSRAYFGLSDQVKRLLANRDIEHLWLTGHSLGGALATVCAYRLESSGDHHLDGLITFGQPRIAKIELARRIDALLDDRYAWFVNGRDMVPKTPESYEPAGLMVWMRGPNDIQIWKRRQVTYASQPGEGQAPETLEPACPLPPLSAEEKQRLREELSDQPPDLFDPEEAVYTSFRPTDHHLMPAYMESLQSLLGVANQQDLDAE
jgi:pimeloyl-ACP methyl ester carboxylesterase